jgi:hypothetical protein
MSANPRLVLLAMAASTAAWADPPVELSVPGAIDAAVAHEAAQRQLIDDDRPAPQPLPAGAIPLSDKVHLVPIRLYPIKAGLHETVAIEVDVERGLRPLRLELAGTGILGGAEGEMNLGKRNRMHGTVINTPNLIFIDAEDTVEVFRARLPWRGELSAGLRAGLELVNTPNLIVAQAYAQAGARLDGLFEGQKLVHFDAFAGSGAILNYNTALAERERFVPGLEVSAALVVEK